MEEELARSGWLVIGPVALRVGTDVKPQEPCLGPLDLGLRLLQVRAAVAQGLHLGPLEHEAGLVGLEDLEVVMRPAIRRDELLAAVAVPQVSAPSSGRGTPRLDGPGTR